MDDHHQQDVMDGEDDVFHFGLEVEGILRVGREMAKCSIFDVYEDVSTKYTDRTYQHYEKTGVKHLYMTYSLSGLKSAERELFWQVKSDSSIHGKDYKTEIGAEFVSPIIQVVKGARDYRSEIEFLFAMNGSNWKVHLPSCGTHVHVSPKSRRWELPAAKRFAIAACFWEHAIQQLVPIHRRDTKWCRRNWQHSRKLKFLNFRDLTKKINEPTEAGDLLDILQSTGVSRGSYDRDYIWNFSNIAPWSTGTIEFRAPGASPTAEKPLAWIDFVCSFARAAVWLDLPSTGAEFKHLDLDHLVAWLNQLSPNDPIQGDSRCGSIFTAATKEQTVGDLLYISSSEIGEFSKLQTKHACSLTPALEKEVEIPQDHLDLAESAIASSSARKKNRPSSSSKAQDTKNFPSSGAKPTRPIHTSKSTFQLISGAEDRQTKSKKPVPQSGNKYVGEIAVHPAQKTGISQNLGNKPIPISGEANSRSGSVITSTSTTISKSRRTHSHIPATPEPASKHAPRRTQTPQKPNASGMAVQHAQGSPEATSVKEKTSSTSGKSYPAVEQPARHVQPRNGSSSKTKQSSGLSVPHAQASQPVMQKPPRSRSGNGSSDQMTHAPASTSQHAESSQRGLQKPINRGTGNGPSTQVTYNPAPSTQYIQPSQSAFPPRPNERQEEYLKRWQEYQRKNHTARNR